MSAKSVCAAFLAGITVAVACKGDDPFVPVVTTIVVSPATRAFFALADTAQFSATVRDQNGDAMTGQAVVWGTSSGTVATVSPTGLVTTQSVGSASITATIGAISGSAAVTVTQVPADLFKFDGDAQSASVGTAVAVPLVVRVLDSAGIAVPGITVGFAVTSGGGSVGTSSGTSNGSGQASTTWTLGTTTGTQNVTASSAGLTSVVFNATALPSPPDTIIKQTTDGQTFPAGTQVSPAPAVLLRDQYDNPVSGISVTFAITQGGGQLSGATVFSNSSGIATVGSWIAGASGTQELTATATGSGIGGNPITFTVTSQAPGPPDDIVVAGGDNQTGLGGYALNTPPSARVRDASNNPVQGVSVDFQVTGGGGGITGATATSDLQGIAQVGSWTINLGANTLTASVAGIATPATFNATGVTSTFNIEVRYLTSVTPSRQAAFDSAAARWSRVIIGDVPDFAANFAAGSCNSPVIPAVNETIDDLLIFAVLDSIDGPGQVLGRAGFCFARSGGAPIFGLMQFDTADVANLEANGLFAPVIMHEMAHVLGLGTLWQSRGLLTGASGSDPFFTGAQARAAFDAIGGSGYTAGGKVPVENTGGQGTRNGHWRESVFTNELMTGFINSGANPLSRVTSAQFGDLGYQVNLAESDAFLLSFPAALRAQLGPTIHLVDDMLRVPIVEVDAAGRVVRVIQPR